MAKVLFINGINDNGIVGVSRIIEDNVLQYVNSGTCNVNRLIHGGTFTSAVLVLDANPSQDINLGGVDLVFNQISDADSHQVSLHKAQSICELLADGTRCINRPDKVMHTTRDQLQEKLKSDTKLIIPETIRLTATSAEDIHDNIISNYGGYPVLIRLCGDHNAKSLTLLEKRSDIGNLSRAFYSRPCYLTQYIDYSDEHGVFAKYRFVSVGDELFMRHAMYSDQWEIHARVRRFFMKQHAEYFETEKHMLASFDEDIKPRIREAMSALRDALELDFFGVDCSFDEQGNMIVFEANANMNLLFNPYPKPNPWQAQVDGINDALVRLIESRIRTAPRSGEAG